MEEDNFLSVYESQESVDAFEIDDIKGTPEHALYKLIKDYKTEFGEFVAQV